MPGGPKGFTETERRRRRERIFRWLAVVHAGPLGMAVAGHPELGRRYPEGYARCPGHPSLVCRASGGVPRVCLPRRFEELAESARRGGRKRRGFEAQRIEELERCLDLLDREKPDFAPVWELTRAMLREAQGY